MPVFINPFAFWGLISLLGIIGIYIFRNRSKPKKVSSLLLWNIPNIPSEGGRKRSTFQAPLLMIIELIIVLLLLLAAAAPRIILGNKVIPIAIILDDSFSMSASIDSASARQKSIDFLEKEIFSRSYFRISLIRAGNECSFVGRRNMLAAEARQFLGLWKCDASKADFNAALRIVNEAFSHKIHTLVLTDHKPDKFLEPKIKWMSFGKPLNNVAITAANRYRLDKKDRCFFEFTNFSKEPVLLKGNIINSDDNSNIKNLNLKISPLSSRRIRFKIPKEISIKAQIENDVIKFDNVVNLLPIARPNINVQLKLSSDYLKSLVKETLFATQRVNLVENKGDLLISDSKILKNELNDWEFRFAIATEPLLVNTSISLNKNHPLTEGLSVPRGKWAVSKSLKHSGLPLISIGSLPLLSISTDKDYAYSFVMNFAPDYSNIQDTIFWPILFHNLIGLRQRLLPGLTEANLRTGMTLKIRPENSTDKLTITSPVGSKRTLKLWADVVEERVSGIGLHEIESGKNKWLAAVNLLNYDESNLLGCESTTGDSLSAEEFIRQSQDVRWWFLLPVLFLLGLHQWLILTRRGQNA
jgi:hypothetical protein